MTPFLSLLVLRARAPEVTRDFYAALGFHFESEQHGSGPIHYAAQLGALVLEIYPLRANQIGADDTTMLGFQVAVLERTLEKFDSTAEIKASQWGRFCSIKDPDGRTIRLTESIPDTL